MITSFEEFQILAQSANVVPVVETLSADTETPVSVFLKLRAESPYAFLLESAEGGEKLGRFSFLGYDPFVLFHVEGKAYRIESRHADVSVLPSLVQLSDSPVEALKKIFAHFRSAPIPWLPRFTCGAVGYFGYEAVGLVENIPTVSLDEMHVPDVSLMFLDTLVIFDSVKHQVYLISNGYCPTQEGSELRKEYDKAVREIARLRGILAKSVPAAQSPGIVEGERKFRTEKSNFAANVDRAREYIKAGDIFQVVLSQRATQRFHGDAFDVYRALRKINPSPYLFYLEMEGTSILGSSPEMLVRVERGSVETRPIAGTRRRGASDAEDAILEKELLADEKERAEHLMLVDLGRNDVGRISQFGRVEVKEFMQVEKYSHVMHLVSSVKGTLRSDLTALDALLAVFPAGTLSGAPKIRAMEIIAELEPVKRNVYGGAVGYLDFSGNLDTCIAIRTAVVHKNLLHLQAGAGIVLDSNAEREYDETIEKLNALIKATEHHQ